MAAGDDAGRVGHDPAVIQKDVDVVLGGQQPADVALEHEVRLHPALDRLLDLRIRGVDQAPWPGSGLRVYFFCGLRT